MPGDELQGERAGCCWRWWWFAVGWQVAESWHRGLGVSGDELRLGGWAMVWALGKVAVVRGWVGS